MEEKKAQQLVKIIGYFAIAVLVILFVVVIVQTVTRNNLSAKEKNLNYESEQVELENKKIEDKLDYYTDPENPSKVKDEVKEDYNRFENDKTSDDDVIFIP